MSKHSLNILKWILLAQKQEQINSTETCFLRVLFSDVSSILANFFSSSLKAACISDILKGNVMFEARPLQPTYCKVPEQHTETQVAPHIVSLMSECVWMLISPDDQMVTVAQVKHFTFCELRVQPNDSRVHVVVYSLQLHLRNTRQHKIKLI